MDGFNVSKSDSSGGEFYVTIGCFTSPPIPDDMPAKAVRLIIETCEKASRQIKYSREYASLFEDKEKGTENDR